MFKRFTNLFKPRRNSGKKVISFSLWGDHPKYLQGALENVRLQRILFPDWVCRFYLDATVPPPIVSQLKDLGCEIVQKQPSEGFFGLYWRFEPGFDASIERFIVRDCDSRLNAREAWAVWDWINSGKPFHILRDHPHHHIPILGGMWGALGNFLPDFDKLYHDWVAHLKKGEHQRGEYFYSDQDFLTKIIWPKIRRNHVAHSETYFVTGKERPFMVKLPEGRFIGQQFDENHRPVLV